MAGKGWTECIVGDVAAAHRNALVGGPFGSNLVSRDYVDIGVPVIRGTNMGDRWLKGNFAFVTPEKADSLLSNIAKPGDLIFTQRGTLGQVSLVPSNSFDRYVISQSQMKLTPDTSKADVTFLYYVFTSKAQLDYIKRNAIQTGVPHTNLGILRETPLTIPPLSEQKAIASILGSLDEKIELNRRMNATLESAARALFKSWFVDFDPVRAKVDGRTPAGMDEATARLFPSAFEDSELGKIPQGWSVGPILEHADLLSGGTPKTSIVEYWGGKIPWASAKDISQCGEAFLIRTERTITASGLENSATKLIDPFSTVVVARGATTGRLTMFGQAIAMNQTCYALRSKHRGHLFLYCHSRDFINKLVYSAHGSVFDTITTRTFETTPVLLPEPSVVQAFEVAVTPIFSQVRAYLHQSQTLASLRDALLPKLLSGEIRVGEAEKQLEKVG